MVAFLDALSRCLQRTEYDALLDALRADFENSVANVTLNRLIGSTLGARAQAIEPAYQGHQYYPFPALRIGPSLSQVVECSNLCQEPVDLPLLRIDGCRLISSVFDNHEACLRSWSGLQVLPRSAALIPLHPWQVHLSPLVRELLARNLATFSRHKVKAIPLASQRTCRIVRTGFDLKMSVDATLTGERRLLYRLNCENAPVISVLAKRLLDARGHAVLDFQEDIASICHTEPTITPHLSVIVRYPVRSLPGEVVIPAINLWAGRQEARALLRSTDFAYIEEFFRRYCRALMTGPVQFCSECGMAFEPHLQNVYMVLRDGFPSRIVLRDLDASILDSRRVRPALRDLGLELPKDTWRVMPSFEVGGKRLVQAMLFGHLGEVMWCLTRDAAIQSQKLVSIVEDMWSELATNAPSASARKSVNRLRGWSDTVKATLRTRLHRATTLEFVSE